MNLVKRVKINERFTFQIGATAQNLTNSPQFAAPNTSIGSASFGRPTRFRIMALTDSLPTITAYSNDVGYECIFAEQLKNFARPGDIVMAISGSGNSPNVLRAIEYANSIGCRTIALTGRDGGKLGPLAQLNIQVSNAHMGRIEDGHMIALHMIGYYFMDTEKAGRF